ncbi:MAG: hypothetical protein ABI846_11445, partial [Rudaea sp.]
VRGREGSVEHVLTTEESGRTIRHLLTAPAPKADGGDWILKPDKEAGFRDRVPAFIDWALLRLRTASENPLPSIRIAMLTRDRNGTWGERINAWDDAFVAAHAKLRERMLGDLRARALELIETWRSAQGRPAIYFPRTSWAALRPEADKAASDAGSRWAGDDTSGGRHKGEREYEPGYAGLLGSGMEFDDAHSADFVHLREFAQVLNRLIEPDTAWVAA